MFLNNTRFSTAENCLRDFFWRNDFLGTGIQPQYIDDDLFFGQIGHLGLACLHKNNDLRAAIAEMNIAIDTYIDEGNLDWEQANTWLGHKEWLQKILTAYRSYSLKEDNFSVEEIEKAGRVVIGDICYACEWPYPSFNPLECPTNCGRCGAEIHSLVFRIDMLVNQFGMLKVVDHKTAKSVNKNYYESWENSMQMIGYTYGSKRLFDKRIEGYGVNVLRKLKTVGDPVKTTKQCPGCRNGKRAKLKCNICNATGRVERENVTTTEPFLRMWYSTTDQQEDLFVRSRLRIAEDISRERERFKIEPDAAWPTNCTSCFKMKRCPFVRLCYDTEPQYWFEPRYDILQLDNNQAGFRQREDDYVTEATMEKEEMR